MTVNIEQATEVFQQRDKFATYLGGVLDDEDIPYDDLTGIVETLIRSGWVDLS